MQIILLETVLNLGKFGDIVEVKNGYARNFLIPKKIACFATKEAIIAFKEKCAELEKISEEKLIAAKLMQQKLNNFVIEVKQKIGTHGRLFGSVTSHDISKILKNHGFDIQKNNIRMPIGHLKRIGSYDLSVAIYTNIFATITVNIISE